MRSDDISAEQGSNQKLNEVRTWLIYPMTPPSKKGGLYHQLGGGSMSMMIDVSQSCERVV